ncbi:MAG: tetratricopeptide repeat protein [Planctomycetota bacterium]|jgi:tetratricopeptide (TPR) repeat protein
MNVKTKNPKSNPNIGYGASLNIFCILCFAFVCLCFLTTSARAQKQSQNPGQTDFLIPYLAQKSQVAGDRTTGQEKLQANGIEAINFADKINQTLPQINTATLGDPSSDPKRQLWRARIRVHEGKEDNKRKNELRRLIELIRSIEFKPPKQPEPIINIRPVETKVETNQTPFDPVVTEESSNNTIEFKSPYESITDRTLQMIGSVAQDPNQLENPFELGEVLYFSGRLEEAIIFYQEALNRKDADKSGLSRDRAWILFQIGNCLKDYDLKKAQSIYRQLITEHPGSPWVEPAKAREKIVNWYLKEKPRTLIAESQL